MVAVVILHSSFICKKSTEVQEYYHLLLSTDFSYQICRIAGPLGNMVDIAQLFGHIFRVSVLMCERSGNVFVNSMLLANVLISYWLDVIDVLGWCVYSISLNQLLVCIASLFLSFPTVRSVGLAIDKGTPDSVFIRQFLFPWLPCIYFGYGTFMIAFVVQSYIVSTCGRRRFQVFAGGLFSLLIGSNCSTEVKCFISSFTLTRFLGCLLS